MPALRVVVVLDVVTDCVVRFGAGLEGAAVHQFLLQRREEALGDGVVPTVARGTHAASGAVLLEQRAVLGARVLAAAVGVMNEPRRRTATSQSMPEGRDGEVAAQRLAKRPADDPTRVEVE
jgi:hypothetical protein